MAESSLNSYRNIKYMENKKPDNAIKKKDSMQMSLYATNVGAAIIP
jgi:hypothetical protein